ncbi:MAG: glycerophosphodiester phosphodiesterase [Verrucomicrobiota bacterium]
MRFIIYLILFLSLFKSSLATMTVAHRGFTTDSVENTLGAIREAWIQEADAVEVDIQILKDGELVLFHDKKISGVQIDTLDYDQLQSIVGSYHVPTLEESLAEVPVSKSILLDLKSETKELSDALVTLLEDDVFDFRVIIQSSSLPLLANLKSRLPESFEYHYLTKLERTGILRRNPSVREIMAEVEGSGITGISFKGRTFIDQKFVDAVRSEGLRFFIWTINEPNRIEHYLQLGVDGIITDNPNASKEIGKDQTD